MDTMNTRWHTQHRPVLSAVVADVDRGADTVDVDACAAALGLSRDDVAASLDTLRDAGFLQTRPVPGTGRTVVTRICPLARQVLGTGPTPRQTITGRAYEQVVLRAPSR